MGATVFYKQVKPKDRKSLGVSSPSFFLEAMERAFGAGPWFLNAADIPTLRGMASVAFTNSKQNPFEELIEAIETFEVIEVWAES